MLRTQVTTATVVLLAAAIVRAAAPAATGARWVLPPSRTADWSKAGVPGGIPARRTKLIDVTKPPYNADRTGVSDAQPAIARAIARASDGEVVYLPAGTYRIDKVIRAAGKRITLRGAGPDKTVIMAHNPTYSAVDLGLAGGADYLWNRPNLDITGSPARGATVLTVAGTKALDSYPNGGVGQICRVHLKNDPSLPVVVPAQWDYQRKQTCRIAARTPTTVTVQPPLMFALPVSPAPKLAVAARHAESAGIEDLTIDATHSPTPHPVVGMTQCYGCWIKNVHVLNVPNYHIGVSDSLQCEIRHCYVARRKGAGSNGAGILFGASTRCLVEDNILTKQFPHIEVNHGSTGNVFAYNYCYDSTINGVIGVSICSNHGAHNSFNLYEGNVAPKFQCDGYHGSASHDTAFRNWFHGTSDKTDKFGICVYLNRFTRHYSIVGNVLGRKGHTYRYDNADNGLGYDDRYIYAFGLPNLGNGGFSGYAQPSVGDYWKDWDKMRSSPRGKGPGPSGFQEIDRDVKATVLLRGNYNYHHKGVPASESLEGAALPKSLYLARKPSWFGDLNWPPFGPDAEFESNRIPAQVRYEKMPKRKD